MRTELISDALLMAIGRRQPLGNLLHHSDRGSQYASADYQQLLKRQGIQVSMSRKGNCWDNAVMERFFGSCSGQVKIDTFLKEISFNFSNCMGLI